MLLIPIDGQYKCEFPDEEPNHDKTSPFRKESLLSMDTPPGISSPNARDSHINEMIFSRKMSSDETAHVSPLGNHPTARVFNTSPMGNISHARSGLVDAGQSRVNALGESSISDSSNLLQRRHHDSRPMLSSASWGLTEAIDPPRMSDFNRQPPSISEEEDRPLLSAFSDPEHLRLTMLQAGIVKTANPIQLQQVPDRQRYHDLRQTVGNHRGGPATYHQHRGRTSTEDCFHYQHNSSHTSISGSLPDSGMRMDRGFSQEGIPLPASDVYGNIPMSLSSHQGRRAPGQMTQGPEGGARPGLLYPASPQYASVTHSPQPLILGQTPFGTAPSLQNSDVVDPNAIRLFHQALDAYGVSVASDVLLRTIDRLPDILVMPKGAALFQRFIDICRPDHRLSILKRIAKTDENSSVGVNQPSMSHLAALSMHPVATRVVQQLVLLIRGSAQLDLLVSALSPWVDTVLADIHGIHVIQKCIKTFSPSSMRFIYTAVAASAIDLATSRHGCCVVQRCIDYGRDFGPDQDVLLTKVVNFALLLTEHRYGNYVIQHIIELGLNEVSQRILEKLQGNFASLSLQKFSSNVVEKFLRQSVPHDTSMYSRAIIIQELVESPQLLTILTHPYGNYVSQSAISVAEGPVLVALAGAITMHTVSLQNNPVGKRILAKLHMQMMMVCSGRAGGKSSLMSFNPAAPPSDPTHYQFFSAP